MEYHGIPWNTIIIKQIQTDPSSPPRDHLLLNRLSQGGEVGPISTCLIMMVFHGISLIMMGSAFHLGCETGTPGFDVECEEHIFSAMEPQHSAIKPRPQIHLKVQAETEQQMQTCLPHRCVSRERKAHF